MQEKVENLFKPNIEEIKQHLTFLFGDCCGYDDGLIEISYTPSNSPAVNQSKYFEVTNIEEAANFAYQANSQSGVNVYVGAALRNPDTAPFGRSSTEDYYSSYVLWCDLDDSEAAKTAKDKYNNLPPSMVVVTGREPNTRAQVWWKLMTPEEDKDLLKNKLAHICNALDGDPAVVDPARVMRLGGTVAYPKKDGRVIEKTEVIVPPHATKMVLIDKFNTYFDIPEDKPLVSTAANSSFKNPITGTFKIKELLENTKNEGCWHFSMRDAISSMVGKDWTDEQIYIATESYKRDRSLVDDMITPLIVSARNKYNHPEPEDKTTAEVIEVVNKDTGEVTQEKLLRELPLIYAGDVTPVLETNDFIEDLLCEEQFSVTYGESNCGKTFAMLDLAMHVATGTRWRDKHVEQGAVLYAALEGGQGTKNRIVAFKKHHGLDSDVPLAIIPSSIDFLDAEGDLQSLLQAIRTAQAKIGNIKLIVIDTLARAISGGDENSGQDMGQMIIHADMIREMTGAHINFVHHSGKDSVKGARGHSSLRAAVDTEIEVSRPDAQSPSIIKVVKQREIEMIDDMGFTLERVSLGITPRNKEVTSCVVLPCDITETDKQAILTDIQQFVYDAIIASIDYCGRERSIFNQPIKSISYRQFYDELEERGYANLEDKDGEVSEKKIINTSKRARVALKEKGLINFNKDYIWLA